MYSALLLMALAPTLFKLDVVAPLVGSGHRKSDATARRVNSGGKQSLLASLRKEIMLAVVVGVCAAC